MRILILAGLVLATTSVANAEPTSSSEAKIEGDRLLAQAGATNLFTNETGSDNTAAIRLRHNASGVLCVFNPGKPLNGVSVSPTPVRGDDVGCTSENITGIRSTFITKTTEGLPTLVAKEVAPMIQRYKGQFKGNVDINLEYKTTLVPLGQEPRKGATVGFQTNNTYERAVFFRTGDWVVEARFTAPPQMARNPSVLDESAVIYIFERERHLSNLPRSPG